MSKLHTSDINLTVELDENRIPEKLKWTAKDGGVDNEEAKAMVVVYLGRQQSRNVAY